MRFLPSFRNLPRILAAFAVCLSAHALALSCSSDTWGTVQTIQLDQPINVSTGNLQTGTVLWRSPVFTSQFTCRDTDGYPQGEDAYFYWDPKKDMQKIDPSLSIGITYQGVDYDPKSSPKLKIGPGTIRDTSCPNGKRCTAKPQTLTVSYSVFIKATGVKPPASGQIDSTGSYSMFQVDGVGGLNTSTPNANFNAYISGLGLIRFIACNPTISVEANQGNIVDFGRIPASNANPGALEKSVPFSVVANLSGEGVGGDCQGQTLQASFSTTYSLDGATTILPSPDAGFGIYLSQPESTARPIEMKTAVDIGLITGDATRLEKGFMANLKWLSDKPKIGPFTATANVDVTFK